MSIGPRWTDGDEQHTPADIAAAYFEAWKANDVDGRIDCVRVTFDPRPLLEP